MAKIKTVFFCKNCGFESGKWIGKCPSCGEWNSFTEEKLVENKKNNSIKIQSEKKAQVKNIIEIENASTQRLNLEDNELARVLGGGIVPGSLILVGGEPGIGKSTLLLQMALQNHYSVLYISGEESDEQIKMRADRIGINNENCYVLTETNLEIITQKIKEIIPQIIIVDSIQTIFTDLIDSAPGSITQIRETAAKFLQIAKENAIPIFLVGHITKEGSIAGPKLLEHMVDVVLQFEGDRHHIYRILRAFKNRFGSTNELGIYEMQSSGMRAVDNPSEVLLSHHDEALTGIAIAAAIEGMRPILLETQSLVSTAVYGTPQRSSTGFDIRRLNLLLAVLEKRCGFRLGALDVFVNIAGGLRIEDPAMDLALIASIMSSYHNVALNKLLVFAGEVGLSGEIRPVQRIEQRILEAEKLGFKEIVISKYNKYKIESTIQIHVFARVEEVFEWLFG